MTIVLASSSAARRELLENSGVSFEIEHPSIDEKVIARENPHWTPKEVASNLALAKARTVSLRRPGCVVIGADQVLAVDGEILHKPVSVDDCKLQLLRLRGRMHCLFTSTCCARSGTVLWDTSATASMVMRPFSDAYLEEYVRLAGEDVLTSVGGYKLESIGIQLFESVAGDYFSILGIVLVPLLTFLREVGECSS